MKILKVTDYAALTEHFTESPLIGSRVYFDLTRYYPVDVIRSIVGDATLFTWEFFGFDKLETSTIITFPQT